MGECVCVCVSQNQLYIKGDSYTFVRYFWWIVCWSWREQGHDIFFNVISLKLSFGSLLDVNGIMERTLNSVRRP